MPQSVKLYLDSSDLIDIAERERPFGIQELERLLRQRGAVLVLSVATISEVAAPLTEPKSSTNVMALLNRLEALPHVFLADARIQRLELESTLQALRTGKPTEVNPFTHRFDDAVQARGVAPTRRFLRYSLAEAVYDTWQSNPSALWHYRRFHPLLKERIEEDRQIPDPPNLKVHFREVLSRQLSWFGVPADPKEMDDLASLLVTNPSVCPTYTLSHEMFALLRGNRTDQVKEGDLLDLVHAFSLPYVDLATMDRRMRAYVSQACGRLNLDFHKRLLPGIEAVATTLKTDG